MGYPFPKISGIVPVYKQLNIKKRPADKINRWTLSALYVNVLTCHCVGDIEPLAGNTPEGLQCHQEPEITILKNLNDIQSIKNIHRQNDMN